MNCDIAPSAKMTIIADWSLYVPTSEAAMPSRVWDETSPFRLTQLLVFRCALQTDATYMTHAAALNRRDPGLESYRKKEHGEQCVAAK